MAKMLKWRFGWDLKEELMCDMLSDFRFFVVTCHRAKETSSQEHQEIVSDKVIEKELELRTKTDK